MEGTCKESFMNQKEKCLLSFYSITEKQDESGNSSIAESKHGKQLIADDNSKKHFLKFSDPKKKLNIKSEIKPINKSTFAKKKSSKSFNTKSKEKEKENLKKILKKESNKRIKGLKKRISGQHAHDDFYIMQLQTRNNSFHMNKKRNSSSKNANMPFNMLNKFNYKNDNANISSLPAYNNILNNNNNNNKLFSMINSNIISSRAMIRNKSINVSSTESINRFYTFNSNKENNEMKAKKVY